MKIIDLLNKIAKGEEVPKKIDYNGEIFIYNEALKRYVNEIDKYSDSSTYCLGGYFALDMSLDHEIKVIEEVEDKEYEDIEETTGDYIVPNTPATENEAYIMACLIAHEQTLNALIRNQKHILERINKERGE